MNSVLFSDTGCSDGIRAVRCRIMKTKYEKLTMRLTGNGYQHVD